MAPRRFSRNKEKRRIDETYDTTLFDSYEHAVKFSTFESRIVHKGKYVDLEDLGELETIQWFANLNALPILQISEPIYPRLVRMFYNNLHVDENDRTSTYLLGHHIPITNGIICNILDITKKEQNYFFRGQWNIETIGVTYQKAISTIFGNPNLSIVPKSCEHFLPFNTKLLHHILISILLPKQHHLDEINTLEINTMYWIMTGRDYCFGYLIRQNMIDISRKDIMLPYGGLITRLLHAHDITISPDEETMKLDKFNIINRNLLRRLRCIVINEIWTRLPRRIDPPPPKPVPNTPIHRGSHSPLTSPFEAIPPTDAAPSSSSKIIAARLDRLELRQDQILTEIQHIHQRLDTFNAHFHTLFRHFGLPKSE
ncbi:unnamed protein product [Musa acuminata subsp. burmannicoides]